MVSDTPISTAHTSAIKELLKELSYQENKDNFVFLFNKTEGLDDDTKLLMEIGSELEVDMNHRIPVATPKPGEGTLETLTFLRAGDEPG